MVTKLFPNVIEFASDFPQAIIDTLLMLVISGLISVVIGILLAVIVVALVLYNISIQKKIQK